MMGTSRRLNEHTRPIRCVAVQPADALHGLEGLKHMPSSLVPAIYDETVPDETMWINTEDGWDMSDRLAREEGLHVGPLVGRQRVRGREDRREAAHASKAAAAWSRSICDRGDRYFAPMKWEKRYAW